MNIFKKDIPIFHAAVICCTGCDAYEAEHAFYTFEDSRIQLEIPDYAAGMVVACYSGGILMWVENPSERASDVFHELVHVAFRICETRGITPDEELLAYLIGWLKKEVADEIFATAMLEQPIIESTEEVEDGV